MRAVWKYPLGPGLNWIVMPKGAQALSTAVQAGEPVLYCLVDPYAPKETYRVVVIGTGMEHMDDELPSHFVGTVLLANDRLVFHVFVEAD